MSPRHSPATQAELARVGLFASLSGETLGRLAREMRRETIGAGEAVVLEGEEGDRFYVVLSGMLTVHQSAQGARRILRPGDTFGEVGAALDMPRTATVRALTTAVVASCDKAAFDEHVRPLFADSE
ncbi:MAG: cAMP-dependent protein kinase regulator [Gaiellaceae bacterium]|nr:cAMP-dependent protein kinase regulator [Gaiellaceae bacterium]